MNCNAVDICQECNPGFYFDKKSKTCKKCENDCVKCSVDGKRCFSCPIDKFTLEETVVTE